MYCRPPWRRILCRRVHKSASQWGWDWLCGKHIGAPASVAPLLECGDDNTVVAVVKVDNDDIEVEVRSMCSIVEVGTVENVHNRFEVDKSVDRRLLEAEVEEEAVVAAHRDRNYIGVA